MMKGLLFLVCCGICTIISAQVNDDFSDGDFTSNPEWSGTSNFGVDNSFEIVESDNQLRSQNVNMGSGVRMAYLSTPDNLDLSSAKVSWSFKIRLDFPQPGSSSTNSNNTSRVYLMSSSADLNNNLNGYFIELRYPSTSVNEIRLFRQDGDTEEEVILSGALQEIVAQSFADVSVTRSEAAVWEVKVNGISQGTATDNTYNLSSYFGVQIRYSANSRDDGFYFDDFVSHVTPVADMESPVIQSVSAISDHQVDVLFSEPVDPTSAENVSNYSIDGQVTIENALVDSDNNSLVHLSTSSLTNGTDYIITINNVEDENGNVILPDSQESFRYLVFSQAQEFDVVVNEYMADPNPVLDNLPDAEYIELYNRSDKFFDLAGWALDEQLLPSFTLAPNAFVIVVEDIDAAEFTSFESLISIDRLSLNNSSEDEIALQDDQGRNIHTIIFQGSEGGISTELINPNGPDYSFDNYDLSIDPTGGTPGRQNSLFDDTPDLSPPVVFAVDVVSNSELEVLFSESVDQISAESTFNYSIEEIAVLNASLDESRKLVRLEIDQLTPGKVKSLTIVGVQDLSGNGSQKISIPIGLPRSPTFNELVITEVMFDPDPQVGLPEREYVELFNPTQDLISSEGLDFSDATNSISIAPFTLNPGEYYVLTTPAGESEFTKNAIGVSGFPSLNNNGEQLIISLEEELIFSLNYSPDWHEEDKSNGGYSLEMKDVNNPCLESAINWVSSQDDRGGTPGEENSITEIIPDNFGPKVISAIAISPDSILVQFNEKVHPSSILSAGAELNPITQIESISFTRDYPFNISVKLIETLDESLPYTLEIDQVKDCLDNESQENSIVFALPVKAEEGDVKLSEVLFNPRLNGVDFVEIYNDSEKYISLKEWKLANLDDDDKLKDIDEVSSAELVLRPKEYLVLTTNSTALLNNYPKGKSENFFEIETIPSFPNSEGDVVIINDSDQVVDALSYDEGMHSTLLENVDGVSLERISFKELSNAQDNWRSASSTEGFATPGYLNSQSIERGTLEGKVEVSPEVFIPGNVGSGRDFTTINYQFEEPGRFANVTIYDQRGRLVKHLVQGASLATQGFFRWDGDTNNGSIARMGYHLIVFEIYDSSGYSEVIKETVVVGRDF